MVLKKQKNIYCFWEIRPVHFLYHDLILHNWKFLLNLMMVRNLPTEIIFHTYKRAFIYLILKLAFLDPALFKGNDITLIKNFFRKHCTNFLIKFHADIFDSCWFCCSQPETIFLLNIIVSKLPSTASMLKLNNSQFLNFN